MSKEVKQMCPTVESYAAHGLDPTLKPIYETGPAASMGGKDEW